MCLLARARSTCRIAPHGGVHLPPHLLQQVRDRDGVDKSIKEAAEKLGGIDILVANAGGWAGCRWGQQLSLPCATQASTSWWPTRVGGRGAGSCRGYLQAPPVGADGRLASPHATRMAAADAGVEVEPCTAVHWVLGLIGEVATLLQCLYTAARMAHAHTLPSSAAPSPGILGALQPADQVAPDVFQDVVETNVLGV